MIIALSSFDGSTDSFTDLYLVDSFQRKRHDNYPRLHSELQELLDKCQNPVASEKLTSD